MGLFDNIKRKRELGKLEKKILNGEAQFEDLPSDLREDINYLLRISASDNNIFNKISDSLVLELVMLKPELGAKLDARKVRNILFIIRNNKEINFSYSRLFSHIPSDVAIEMFDDIPPEEIRNVYKIEEQVTILKKELKIVLGRKKDNSINKILNYFDSEAIYVLVRERRAAYEESIKKPSYYEFSSNIDKLDFASLPVDVQVEVIKIEPELMCDVTIEALEKYLNYNSLLLDTVIKARQNEGSLIIAKKFNTYLHFWNLITNRFQLTEEDKKCLTIENGKKFLAFLPNGPVDRITDFFRKERLVELAKFDASAVRIRYGNNDRKPKYLSILYSDYISKHMDHYRARPLLEYFDTSGDEYNFFKRIGYNWGGSSEEFSDRFSFVPKIVLNDTILANCDSNLILELIKNPNNRDLLLDVVEQAFGKEARKILEDRPQITFKEIPTFDIFDRSIFDNFGAGVIHNILSYNNKDGNIIGELARNPQKMARFKKFSDILKENFDDRAIDFHKKLNMFLDLDDILLEKINLEYLTPEEKANMLLFVTDRYQNDNINPTFNATSLQELQNYEERRNQIFAEAMEKTNDPIVLKNIIFKRFFGLDYYRNSSFYTPSTADFVSVRERFNLDTFLTNTRTKEVTDLTDQELDMLEIANIISRINDPEILRDIFSSLGKRNDILGLEDFKSIREKIALTYTRELISSLTTVEDLDKMIQDGQFGIKHDKEEEVDVYRLEGAPFRMFIHRPGLNNSGLRNIHSSMSVDESVESWMTLEEGVSTISGCVIEPYLLESCSRDGVISYGFTSIDPSSISGMGHTDIFCSHHTRQLETSFEYNRVSYEYPDELVRKTRAQIDGGIDHDPSHPYNEVTIYRREHDPSRIGEGTFGGKRIPDYIVCYGSDCLDSAKKTAQLFAEYNGGKPLPVIVINTKIYRDSRALDYPDYMRAKKEEHQQRADSEVVAAVREASRR